MIQVSMNLGGVPTDTIPHHMLPVVDEVVAEVSSRLESGGAGRQLDGPALILTESVGTLATPVAMNVFKKTCQG